MQFFWQIFQLLQIPKFCRKSVHSNPSLLFNPCNINLHLIMYSTWWSVRSVMYNTLRTLMIATHIYQRANMYWTTYIYMQFFGRFSNFYKFQNFVEKLCTEYITTIHYIYMQFFRQILQLLQIPKFRRKTVHRVHHYYTLHIHAIFLADSATFTNSKIS